MGALEERQGADAVTREAYSHEVISFGFWPGGRLPGGASVAPGGRLESLKPVFEKARAAALEGRAVEGMSIEI